MNCKTAFISVALACAFAMLSSPTYFLVHAQDTTNFTPTTHFAIPASNSTIAFATSGSYENASLNNNTWDFTGFALSTTNGYLPTAPMGNNNFSVTAQNCKATILCLDSLNRFPPYPGWLNYTVAGVGSQAFNMYYGTNYGMAIDWTVYIDGTNKTQNDGWTISTEGWLTVTGANSNVSIYRQNIDPVTVKIREFKAQGFNDTQITAELSKLGMVWNPETGATAIGTTLSPEEQAHMPIPSSLTAPTNYPSPISTNSQRDSPKPIGISAENLYVFYAALAVATGILIIAATALVIRKEVLEKP